jgi:hypothetical protein
MLLAAVKRDPDPDAVSAEPAPGDATRTEETLTDQQDVGADAAAHQEPDAEKESGVDPGARGGTDTSAEEQPDKLY